MGFLNALLKKENKTAYINNMILFDFICVDSQEANVFSKYTLELYNGIYTAGVKKPNIKMEQMRYLQVNTDFVDKLEALLNINNVAKWNGFYKTRKRVMDGSSFTLRIKMLDGVSVEAHGRMKWPKNYKQVLKGVDVLFSNL